MPTARLQPLSIATSITTSFSLFLSNPYYATRIKDITWMIDYNKNSKTRGICSTSNVKTPINNASTGLFTFYVLIAKSCFVIIKDVAPPARTTVSSCVERKGLRLLTLIWFGYTRLRVIFCIIIEIEVWNLKLISI